MEGDPLELDSSRTDSLKAAAAVSARRLDVRTILFDSTQNSTQRSRTIGPESVDELSGVPNLISQERTIPKDDRVSAENNLIFIHHNDDESGWKV